MNGTMYHVATATRFWTRCWLPAASMTLAVALWTLDTAAAPSPSQIQFQRDLQTAQRQAKQTGIPMMTVLASKGVQSHPALSDRRVVEMSLRYWNVLLSPAGAPGSQVVKKYSLTGAFNVIFQDGGGELLVKVGPEFTADELLAAMKTAAAKARDKLLEQLQDGNRPAAAHKTAIESFLKLGPGPADLIPLLAHKTPAVKTAANNALAAHEPEKCVFLLLDALASPDGDVRAAAYATAAAITKTPGIPPLEFWQKAPESERKTALEKWRQAAYAKYSPFNQQVLDFALANMGKQVGGGECAHLATEALKANNGQRMKHVGKTYVWGRELAPTEKVIPGDIVQMEDCIFSNGSKAPHHTQIIWKVLGPGKYEVLEQNWAGRRTVGGGKLDVNSLKEGTVVIYRPRLVGQLN